MFNPLQPEIRSIFWPVEDSVRDSPITDRASMGGSTTGPPNSPDCCLRSTKRALRSSHKPQRSDADPDTGREDRPQCRKAGHQRRTGSEDIVDEEHVGGAGGSLGCMLAAYAEGPGNVP